MTYISTTTRWQEAMALATPEPVFLLLVWMGGVGLFILAAMQLWDKWTRHKSRQKRLPVVPATDKDLLS